MQPVYVRYAHKAQKLVLDLSTARDRVLIAYDCVAVTVLDKGAGSFQLHFIFFDKTELQLDQDELADGDSFSWDISELRITNSAQPDLRLKLLLEFQVES